MEFEPESISYITQQEAAEIDELLMGPLGFSVDQLMVNFFNFFSCFRSAKFHVLLSFMNPFDWIVRNGFSGLFSFQELAGLSVASAIAQVKIILV